MLKQLKRYWIGLVLCVLHKGLAFAQVNSQDLRPSLNFDYILLEDSLSAPYVDGEIQYGSGPLLELQFNSMDNPLTMFDVNGENRKNIVEKISSLSIGAKANLTKTLSTAIDSSLSQIQIEGHNHGPKVGDTRLQLEQQFLDWTQHPLGLSFTANVTLPTGSQELFLSNGSVGLGGTLAIERSLGSLRLAANVGYTSYEKATYQSLDLRQQVPLGLGGTLKLGRTFSLNLEGRAIHLPDNPSSVLGEAYFGAQIDLQHNGRLYFGVSSSHIETDGSPSARFIAGYKLVPWKKAPETDAKVIVERFETIRTIDRCGPQEILRSIYARRLSASELEQNPLPYQSTKERTVGVRHLGEMTGLLQNLPYVENTQILFAIDLMSLPPKNSIINIQSAFLKMNVVKVSKEKSKDTEILCILNKKICSGETFQNSKWKANINQKFFEGKETPNDYFTKQYINNPIEIRNGREIYAGDLIVDLQQVLENSLVPGLTELFFNKESDSANTLFFSVADDTYISNHVQMDISLTIDSCKTSVPESPKDRDL